MAAAVVDEVRPDVTAWPDKLPASVRESEPMQGLFAMMQDCWSHAPDARPTMGEVTERVAPWDSYDPLAMPYV